jgi:AmmeMemoRadiSam system protein B
MDEVRPSAVAGRWYPANPQRLAEEVDGYLADSPDDPAPKPLALVAPHAGLIYSGPVAAHAYKRVAAHRYAAVVLVGPSHFVDFRGVSIWPRGAWDTPFGEVPVAEPLAAAIAEESGEVVERADAHRREHSLEMQLPFIARVLPGTPIVPLVMGAQTRRTAETLGDSLAKAIGKWTDDTGRVLLVASSDLSHYMDATTASGMDAVVIRHVEAFDAEGLMRTLEIEPRHACGGGPIVSVLRAAGQLGATSSRVVRYADSGDVSGDKSAVVGYMAAVVG